MNAVEWNKKEELVADQALKHLKQYASLLASVTTGGRSQLALIVRMQEFCYDNMNFLKVFSRIVVLFYKGEQRFHRFVTDISIFGWKKRAGCFFNVFLNLI